MVSLTDGSWLFPFRLAQLANSLIGLDLRKPALILVFACAIIGRLTLPGFASPVGSDNILFGTVGLALFSLMWLGYCACLDHGGAVIALLCVQMWKQNPCCCSDR